MFNHSIQHGDGFKSLSTSRSTGMPVLIASAERILQGLDQLPQPSGSPPVLLAVVTGYPGAGKTTLTSGNENPAALDKLLKSPLVQVAHMDELHNWQASKSLEPLREKFEDERVYYQALSEYYQEITTKVIESALKQRNGARLVILDGGGMPEHFKKSFSDLGLTSSHLTYLDCSAEERTARLRARGPHWNFTDFDATVVAHQREQAGTYGYRIVQNSAAAGGVMTAARHVLEDIERYVTFEVAREKLAHAIGQMPYGTKPSIVLLTGSSGSGKTYTMHSLTNALLDRGLPQVRGFDLDDNPGIIREEDVPAELRDGTWTSKEVTGEIRAMLQHSYQMRVERWVSHLGASEPDVKLIFFSGAVDPKTFARLCDANGIERRMVILLEPSAAERQRRLGALRNQEALSLNSSVEQYAAYLRREVESEGAMVLESFDTSVNEQRRIEEMIFTAVIKFNSEDPESVLLPGEADEI